jgi:hypothetical protein
VAYAEGEGPVNRTRRFGVDDIDLVVFAAPTPGWATVSLWLDGEGEISNQRYEVSPSFKAWPSSIVLRVLDPKHERLRADLGSVMADEQERGVAMLLGLLGCSTFWWPRRMRDPLQMARGVAPDVVALRLENSGVLVVECTTEQPGDAKLNRLHGRAENIRAVLKEAFGTGAPETSALMVIAQPRSQISSAILSAADKNAMGLMCKDDCSELVEMIEEGQSRAEVWNRFEQLFPRARQPGVLELGSMIPGL